MRIRMNDTEKSMAKYKSLPIKMTASLMIERYPNKYIYCHQCGGKGKSVYLSKFTDGNDGKLEKCTMCNGSGYLDKQ